MDITSHSHSFQKYTTSAMNKNFTTLILSVSLSLAKLTLTECRQLCECHINYNYLRFGFCMRIPIIFFVQRFNAPKIFRVYRFFFASLSTKTIKCQCTNMDNITTLWIMCTWYILMNGCHHTESLIFFERYKTKMGKLYRLVDLAHYHHIHVTYSMDMPNTQTTHRCSNVTMKFHQHFMTIKRGLGYYQIVTLLNLNSNSFIAIHCVCLSV